MPPKDKSDVLSSTQDLLKSVQEAQEQVNKNDADLDDLSQRLVENTNKLEQSIATAAELLKRQQEKLEFSIPSPTPVKKDKLNLQLLKASQDLANALNNLRLSLDQKNENQNVNNLTSVGKQGLVGETNKETLIGAAKQGVPGELLEQSPILIDPDLGKSASLQEIVEKIDKTTENLSKLVSAPKVPSNIEMPPLEQTAVENIDYNKRLEQINKDMDQFEEKRVQTVIKSETQWKDDLFKHLMTLSNKTKLSEKMTEEERKKSLDIIDLYRDNAAVITTEKVEQQQNSLVIRMEGGKKRVEINIENEKQGKKVTTLFSGKKPTDAEIVLHFESFAQLRRSAVINDRNIKLCGCDDPDFAFKIKVYGERAGFDISLDDVSAKAYNKYVKENPDIEKKYNQNLRIISNPKLKPEEKRILDNIDKEYSNIKNNGVPPDSNNISRRHTAAAGSLQKITDTRNKNRELFEKKARPKSSPPKLLPRPRSKPVDPKP